VDSNPPGVGYSGGSFLTNCPCWPNDEAALLLDNFSGDCGFVLGVLRGFEASI
jgi:hypothetical protein